MKRFLKWAAIAIAGCLVLLLVSGVVWEQVERRQVAAAYPVPGSLVDIGGGRRMQIECRGSGSPTVVFETGLDFFGELSWAKVFPPVAQFTHACVYSRAGMLWSDDKRGRHDGLGVTHDLHAALAGVGEKGPFVMVGLSMGGLYSSLYTGLYGDQVAGLVYVDASHPDQFERYEAVLGRRLPVRDQSLEAMLSWTSLLRLEASLLARNSKAMATMPPKLKEISLAFYPTSLGAMQSERAAWPTTNQEAGVYRNLGARPVVVLTHGKPVYTDMSREDAEKLERTWLQMQKEIATWSSHGRQRTISDSGHYIPNDDPDAVIAAIREVVDDVRSAK